MSDANALFDLAGVSLDSLIESTSDQFKAKFGAAPKWLVAAPGRVNLIGEHTDYNGGYVLPMAIERYVVIAGSLRSAEDGGGDDSTARVYSSNVNEMAEVTTSGKIATASATWSSYVQGVVAGFRNHDYQLSPLDALIQSNVPLGAGLSSSAALEVAFATLLEETLGQSLGKVEKALLCQEAEHKFAGVPCGIMDQFSSVFCEQDKLMLLDCRSQAIELVPLTDPDVTVLIINSHVEHELTGSEYAERRAQCEAAAELLGIATLRDLTCEKLEASRPALDGVPYRRARHVVSEIERTVKAAEAIRDGKWHEVGELMYASHESLRDDFEVSCMQLDVLVELAREIGQRGGVIGSRMTGGGFGGCTVSLVHTESAASIANAIHQRYRKRTGIEPTLFTTRPARGAHVIQTGRP